MAGRRFEPGLLAVACLLSSLRASAQVDLGSLARRMSPRAALPALFSSGRGGQIPLLVRANAGVVNAPGLTNIGNFAIGELDSARVCDLARAHPEWTFDWAPPRHVLLDKVDGWVHAASVRKQTQTSGRGVVVGIVDTGVDLTHADLQTADQKTRVAWLLDVSRDAVGLHPDLESSYGCTDSSAGCAIYAGSDLDALLANDKKRNLSGDAPTDPSGHGTHVASLAAGNGLANKVPTYIGIAPEATYVIARVATASGGIQDADVLRAVKFVFDRAADLGMPAVVNLSLGSDFGAHDGSSLLEAGLLSLVGPDFPGRAIVIAAGNSAGLYAGLESPYPGPFGIHTEVHVPRDSVSLVPLLTPALSGNQIHGSAYVWLGFRDGDEVSVGVDDKSGSWISAVPVGQSTVSERAGLSVTILNGISNADGNSPSAGRNGAIVAFESKDSDSNPLAAWSADYNFKIHLEGHGTAELWVQGIGDLDPNVGLGALFPRGLKEGTINVPASASGLIAVGATLNRTTWVSAAGTNVDMPDLGALSNAPLDTVAYFSSGGPNALGALKPDIVAPGVAVVGAMAPSADPRNNGGVGLFASAGRCVGDEECFVVDNAHAVTSGTSMSAPIVSGAIALLFEQNPTLTQDSVRAILQAGARPLQGIVLDERQIGPGALDLENALSVATAGDSPALRIPGTPSWIVLSESYAHPDPNWPIAGFVELRDEHGQIADGFDDRQLQLVAEPASVTENLTRVAAGLYRFTFCAPEGSGGETLHLKVLFDDTPLVSRDLPIAVDRWVADYGVSARGGCSWTGRHPRDGTTWPGALFLGVVLARRRRHIRAK